MFANVHYCACSVQVSETSRLKTNLEEFTNNLSEQLSLDF